MQSPNPPRPPYPPRPGWRPGDSDRDLVAQLGDGDSGALAVPLLLARHWQATYDYAGICLATTGSSADMVATAAFHGVVGGLAAGDIGGALRPRLLVAVRDTVREWAGEDGVSAVLPELRKTVGGRGLRAARARTPERRQLAERAFRSLPAASQCLLWHTEVEAEPISVPAELLGVDSATAEAAREQAREQFRTGCVRAHRELAPSRECRFYNRLLDIPMRRGGALLPDVQRHLKECRYCRHAAEQLGHFDGGLEVLLAETVLGWGAHRYLDSRPGRGTERRKPPTTARPGSGGGRHRGGQGGLLLGAPSRHPKAVLVGVGLATLALLATVLVTKGWTDDNGVPGPHATWGAPVGSSTSPDESTPAGSPSAASAGRPTEIAHGRLRSLGAGLCLDVRGGRAEAGAGTEPAVCSSAGSQQWSYQSDGRLRSAAEPALCLASDTRSGRVTLAGCLAHSGRVSYDLTVRGELLLRGPEGLLVAPGTGTSSTDVVVSERDGSRRQRWQLESVVNGTGQASPSAKREDEPTVTSRDRTWALGTQPRD